MRPRLLIIDDDPMFHEDIALLLGDRFTIDGALTSESGLRLLRENKYDLILLDLAIPSFLAERDENEGLAIYLWLREQNMKGKVAIVTGQSRLLDIAAEVVNKDTHVYRKPLSEHDLEELISSLP